MKASDIQSATERLSNLKSEYMVDIVSDWGFGNPGDSNTWREGNWSVPELNNLQGIVSLLSSLMGGSGKFIQNLGGVTIRKSDIGSHGGEANSHRISLSTKGTFTSWTVVHEFAHAWDANHGWQLSAALEKYTGGYTSLAQSFMKRILGNSDSGIWKDEARPGRRGRLPGCNAAGYFYGDKPSGSNWKFNRKEDFAESVAMYTGWKRNNDLSSWAEARINRYLLENGVNDTNFGVDNWADYKSYFYPENGDYTKTKHWQFVDNLILGKISAL
jgi:hypothetical protein